VTVVCTKINLGWKGLTAAAEGNFTHKVNYRYCCHFPGLKFMQLLEKVEGLPSQGEVMVEFSKQPPSWKIILEMTTGNVVICEVYVLMHVVQSEEEKHVPYACRTKRGRKARGLCMSYKARKKSTWLMHVVQSEEEKHVPYACRTKLGRKARAL